MSGAAGPLAGVFARFLEPDEREAVLGDLTEAGQGAWKTLYDVLGLVVRRQAALWNNWRPWLAALGLAIPGAFLLMGLSVSVSQTFQHFFDTTILHATGPARSPGLSFLVWQVLLLAAWSWSGGFVVGSLARRTVWVSAALSCLPCLFCLSRFRIESLPRLCLLLFVAPAVWGALRGLRFPHLQRTSAIVLAAAVTALTIPTWIGKDPWNPNWALIWPAWYLVAASRKPALPSSIEKQCRRNGS